MVVRVRCIVTSIQDPGICIAEAFSREDVDFSLYAAERSAVQVYRSDPMISDRI